MASRRPAAVGRLTGVPLLLSALVDLVLPLACPGCGRPSTAACPRCVARLDRGPARVWPQPCPPRLPETWAVADYDGAVRALLLAHKEHGRLALSRPLGSALAGAVCAARPASPVVLVPVPSRRAARRSRGFDPTARLARAAVTAMRSQGLDARLLPALAHARAVRDSAGLSSAERAANLHRAFTVLPGRHEAVRAADLVVVDDVMTTGATLTEAARALRAAGARPPRAAVVAVTRRRFPDHHAHAEDRGSSVRV